MRLQVTVIYENGEKETRVYPISGLAFSLPYPQDGVFYFQLPETLRSDGGQNDFDQIPLHRIARIEQRWLPDTTSEPAVPTGLRQIDLEEDIAP